MLYSNWKPLIVLYLLIGAIPCQIRADRIYISPGGPAVPTGATQAFAVVRYSDDGGVAVEEESVIWECDPSIGTIAPDGILTAIASPAYSFFGVHATAHDGLEAWATVSVVAPAITGGLKSGSSWGTGSPEHVGAIAGVAFDANNVLYISDSKNNRVVKFDEDMQPVMSWRYVTGSPPAPAQPSGLLVDGRGHLYANFSGTLVEFTQSGDVVSTRPAGGSKMVFGPDGSIYACDTVTIRRLQNPDLPNTQFLNVTSGNSCGVDAEGFVYAVHTSQHTITKHTSSGTQLALWQGSYINTPLDVCQTGDGGIVVLGATSITKLDTSGALLGQETLQPAYRFTALYPDPTGIVWGLDLFDKTWLAGFTSPGSAWYQISFPRPLHNLYSPADVARAPDGRLFIVDTEDDTCKIFHPDGRFIQAIATPPQKSLAPGVRAVSVGPDGSFYVATADSVCKFSAGGNPVWMLPWIAHALTTNSDGDVFVARYLDNAIYQYSSDGQYLRTFGGPGYVFPAVHTVGGIKVDSDGNLYESRYQDRVVRKYAPTGALLASFNLTDPNIFLGQVNPGALALTEGRLFIDSSTGGIVQMRLDQHYETAAYLDALSADADPAGTLYTLYGARLREYSVLPVVTTPGAARQLPAGTPFVLTDVVSGAGVADIGVSGALQDPMGSSGIRCQGLSFGNRRYSVTGTISVKNGEALMTALQPESVGNVTVRPLFVPLSHLGGGASGLQGPVSVKPGSAGGPSQVGMLVKTFGRVQSVDTASRTIVLEDPDGSTAKCVYSPRITASGAWSYAIITGVCAVDQVGEELRPLILVRTQTDIQAW
ncbi:MAG: hypothetical protein IT209_00330 [Armatimonadetes bacterium]|nr:hypothetical protein [Armatimonadota bacterium]